jgi:hypothetical protein
MTNGAGAAGLGRPGREDPMKPVIGVRSDAVTRRELSVAGGGSGLHRMTA